MGKAQFYLGGAGKGTEMKLVVNMVMGAWLASLGEGVGLAERAGLKAEDVISVLELGAMACPLVKVRRGGLVLWEGFLFGARCCCLGGRWMAMGSRCSSWGRCLPACQGWSRGFNLWSLCRGRILMMRAIVREHGRRPA
jgi:hypothetical protein